MPGSTVIVNRGTFFVRNAYNRYVALAGLHRDYFVGVGDAAGAAVEGELQHVACSVYRCALRVLPAVLRQWWNNQDKRTAAIVDR